MKTIWMIGTLVAVSIAISTCGSQKKDNIYTSTSESGNLEEIKPTPVEIVDTCNLWIYYPNYSRIDLVCGEMP